MWGAEITHKFTTKFQIFEAMSKLRALRALAIFKSNGRPGAPDGASPRGSRDLLRKRCKSYVLFSIWRGVQSKRGKKGMGQLYSELSAAVSGAVETFHAEGALRHLPGAADRRPEVIALAHLDCV